MVIHQEFPGGNIEVAGIWGDGVWLRPALRDSAGSWFYWAFGVRGAAGKTLTFRFPGDFLGYFGPAVSRDLRTWSWAGADCLLEGRTGFTYRFLEGEDELWFAHHLLYPAGRFAEFAKGLSLPVRSLTVSRGGKPVPMLSFGVGEKKILLTSRHHACESPGAYVLEGAAEQLFKDLPKGFCVTAVPFMDTDGVLKGDQGKNRIPHDHNRDYTADPLYPEVRALKELSPPYVAVDFHAPWHLSGRNDRVFFVERPQNEGEQRAFAEYFARACEKLPLRYTGEGDIAPYEEWNQPTGVSCSGYFSGISGTRLALTLETPYFGTPENRCEQESFIGLGRAFGRALCRYIAKEPGE